MRKKKNELESIIGSGSQEVKDFLELGAILFEEADYEKVISLYKKALEIPSNDLDKAQLFYELGLALCELKGQCEARPYFEKSINIIDMMNKKENTPDVLELKGLNYFQLSWMEPSRKDVCLKAIESFEEFIAKHSNSESLLDVHLRLSRLYSYLGNNDRALEFSLNALGFAKSTQEKLNLFLTIADIFRLKGNYKDAELNYNKALSFAKSDKNLLSEIYYGMGVVYSETDDINNAIKYFELSLTNLKYKPVSIDTQEFLLKVTKVAGDLSLKNKDYKKAKEHYSNVLKNINEAHEDFCNLHLKLGHCFYELKEYNKAQNSYEIVLKCKNTTEGLKIEATRFSGSVYIQLMDFAKAAEIYEQLLEISPGQIEDLGVLYDLGIAYARIDKAAKAINCFEKLITKNLSMQQKENVLYMLASLYMAFEQVEQANKYFDILKMEFPNSLLTEKLKKFFM